MITAFTHEGQGLHATGEHRNCRTAVVRDHPGRNRLPDRGRRRGAHRLGPRREGLHAGQRRQHEAAVEAEAREHAARDAQPVCAAHRRARHDAAGAARDRPSSPASPTTCSASTSPTGRQIWHRRFDSTLANPGGTNDTLCPGGQTAVPTMAQASPGQVHGLRRVVGRAAAPGQPRRRRGRRAAREVHSGRRQAVRAQPARRRHLHRDRAGLRRPDQRVLLVRPRDAPRQRVHSRRRRPVGPPRRGDRSRRAASTSAPATRSSIR